MRGLGFVLIAGICAYIAICALAYFKQSRFVYFPNREIIGTPDQRGIDYESLRIETSDGLKLHAWFLPVENARAVLLFFHGNAGNISDRMESLEIFRGLGLSTLIVDYRGYGLSEGRPGEKGTCLDAEAAWRHLVDERSIPPEKIVVFGRSLGGAVAAWLASRYTPRALIVESAYTSIPDLGAKLYPFLPVRLLSRIRYDALKEISGVDCPVLVVHSREDEIVPFRHGERLYEAANPPKEFLELRGGHNDAFYLSGREYIDALDAFLTRYTGRRKVR